MCAQPMPPRPKRGPNTRPVALAKKATRSDRPVNKAARSDKATPSKKNVSKKKARQNLQTSMATVSYEDDE